MMHFADRAGARTVENRFKPLRAPGLAHTQSMGNIIFGSGVQQTPRGIRVTDVTGAGHKKPLRSEGKSCAASRCTRDGLQLGVSEHPSLYFRDEQFTEYAGRAKKERAGKKSLCLKSISAVDKLLYGRDLSKAGTDALRGYAERFSGYAGNSWKLPKKWKTESNSPAFKPEARVEAVQAELAQGREGEDVKQSTLDPSTLNTETLKPEELVADAKAEPSVAFLSEPTTPEVVRAEPSTDSGRLTPFGIRRGSSSSGSQTPSGQRPRWQ